MALRDHWTRARWAGQGHESSDILASADAPSFTRPTLRAQGHESWPTLRGQDPRRFSLKDDGNLPIFPATAHDRVEEGLEELRAYAGENGGLVHVDNVYNKLVDLAGTFGISRNFVGSVFLAGSKSGEFVRIEEQRSSRPSSHHHRSGLYRWIRYANTAELREAASRAPADMVEAS
jgi:hypothetical protein